MAQQTIDPKGPPIVWSTVEEAFNKINANFDELYGSMGGPGGIIDFTSLSTNVNPSTTGIYDLGSASYRWKDLYLSGSSLHLGNAVISSDVYGVVSINNQVVRSFKNIAVAGQNTVEAETVSDTLNLANGNAGITITTNSTTDTITITNSGILNINGTSGQIGANTVNGVTTLTNLGVTSLTGETGGINVSSATGNITITNLGVKQLVAGTGISLSPAGGTGNVVVTNTLPGSPTFRSIRVDGDIVNQVQADVGDLNDILNLTSGAGITITPDPATDTITFSVNSTLDIKGSVFAFDSSLIVDGTSGTVLGNISTQQLRTSETRVVLGYLAGSIGGSGAAVTIGPAAGVTNQGTGAMAIGPYAGETNQGTSGMAIGPFAGNTGQGLTTLAVGAYAGQTNQGNVATAIGAFAGNNGQGTNAVAIGPYAGGTNQGASSIAIGLYAGSLNQSANSIVINASGVALNGTAAGFYVNPIRSNTAGRVAIYDTTTYEVSYTNLEINGGLISTADSSGINIDVLTTFNTDVVVENDLYVTQRLLLQGSRVVTLSELKTIVAASADFTDFKSKIAALN